MWYVWIWPHVQNSNFLYAFTPTKTQPQNYNLNNNNNYNHISLYSIHKFYFRFKNCLQSLQNSLSLKFISSLCTIMRNLTRKLYHMVLFVLIISILYVEKYNKLKLTLEWISLVLSWFVSNETPIQYIFMFYKTMYENKYGRLNCFGSTF